MLTAPLLILALLLDYLLGEPRRWHPLVGFGAIATRLERGFNPHPEQMPVWLGRLSGVSALLLAVTPWVILATLVCEQPVVGPIASVLVLYFTVGHRSLMEHARAVAAPLLSGDLAAARAAVARMVSRDCAAMDEPAVARATIESVLENGNDATFGALFWFVVAGAPGALAYRLVNCLDAMWGYRTPRFRHFGWAAARLDDVLNYVPARLTVLAYACSGRFRQALACARLQGPRAKSPNGGLVMAAGAGALDISIGGGAVYHGHWLPQPVFGAGRAATPQDIGNTINLMTKALLVWIAFVMVAESLWLLLIRFLL